MARHLDDIRNFCIIAHIDHGKSTLADRLIQRCGGVEDRDFRDQILDSMDIERERGITIKSNTITLRYTARDGKTYRLNLIDTPGHVDFSHEVRRSLMSCEGALLLVDASQGVEAQTVANLYLALEYDLEIIPVINKIDLPSADIDRIREEIDADLGLDPFEAVLCSAKQGIGIDDVLEAIVTKLPPPTGDPEAPLRALIFDAQYDPYRGVVLICRIKEGTIRPGQKVLLMHTDKEYEVEEVGLLQLKRVKTEQLDGRRRGLRHRRRQGGLARSTSATPSPRPTAPPPSPCRATRRRSRWSSPRIYPIATDDYEDLAKALDKLKLNDASLTFQKDASTALGFGFRCGFLGLLHLEIVQERLEREYDLSLLLSAPSVQYEVVLTDDTLVMVDNPAFYPDPGSIKLTREPYIKASIMIPERYLGAVIEICRERRGYSTTYDFLAVGRVQVISRAAAGRDPLRLLRPPEDSHPGLWLVRLRHHRLSRVRPGEGGHPGQRRQGGRPLAARPPREGPPARPPLLRAAGRDHPPAELQDRHPGRHRRQRSSPARPSTPTART